MDTDHDKKIKSLTKIIVMGWSHEKTLNPDVDDLEFFGRLPQPKKRQETKN